MSRDYSVNAIMKGKLVVVDYRDYQPKGRDWVGLDWFQLMNAVALIAHGRNLEVYGYLNRGYLGSLPEKELWNGRPLG